MGARKLQTSSELGQSSEALLLTKLEEISNMRTVDEKNVALFGIIRGGYNWNGEASHKLIGVINGIAITGKDREDSISFDRLCDAILQMNLPGHYQEKTEETIMEIRTRALSLVSNGGRIYSYGGRGYRL